MKTFVVTALQKPIFCGDATETLTVKEMKELAIIKVNALQIYSSFHDDVCSLYYTGNEVPCYW